MRTTAGRAAIAASIGVSVVIAGSGCGVVPTQKQHDELEARTQVLEKALAAEKAQSEAMKSELDATRARLDNALRVNADNGTDLMSEKQRLNQLVGQVDELSHQVEETNKSVAQSRSEIDARLDEMKRAQVAQTPQPPPVTIPADAKAHYAAIESAYGQRDWAMVRTLGREYVSRYPTDEKADDVAFFMGDANLKDNRPSAALGELNHVLKANPPSNVLDKALFAMGEAYLELHDCENAKLAFSTCSTRFGKTPLGKEAKDHVAALAKPAPGTCAPP